MKVHLVVAPGVDVLAIYYNRVHAEVHANTVMGGQVLSMDVWDDYPTAVINDLMSDNDFEDDQETPVEVPVPTRSKPKTQP